MLLISVELTFKYCILFSSNALNTLFLQDGRSTATEEGQSDEKKKKEIQAGQSSTIGRINLEWRVVITLFCLSMLPWHTKTTMSSKLVNSNHQ